MHWYGAKCATEEEKRPSNPIWTDDITDCIFAKAISSPVENIILDINSTYCIFVTWEAELRFVATVATGGRVKFVPAV